MKTVSAAIRPRLTDPGFPFRDGLFGINAEITRKGFFGGLSAQMLNNRKLYAGMDTVSGWECDRFIRVTDRPEESLCGSRFVILQDGGSMYQTSEVIALRKDREYEAKLWVRAVSDTVRITFGVQGMEQTFTVTADGEKYKTLSFTFRGTDTDCGTFVIRTAGETAVFEVSLIPVDHYYGMRLDVIESLRAIAPTSIRFPGGCFADHCEWREGLKPAELRTPVDGSSKWFMLRDTYDQDCLDIGINEFIMLCRALDAKPEYTVSLLLSDGEDARQLVEYCNGGPDTEYGGKRQALGYDSFDIRTWYVGNEVYYFGGEYQKDGRLAAERTNEIVHAMRRADPGIAVVLGLVSDEHLQKWSFDYLENLTCSYEYVSYHRYNGTVPTSEPDGKTACENLEKSFLCDTDAGLDFYREHLFADRFPETKLIVDEWNFCWGSGSNNALLFSNALQFHFFARTAEKYHIREARFFMPVNEGMITVTGTESRIESSGTLFTLMAPHRGGRVIPCGAESDALDILCTEKDGTLYVSAVNRSAEPVLLTAQGYMTSDMTEIRVGTFSFFSNDYEIVHPAEAVVHGYSVLFVTLRRLTRDTTSSIPAGS